MDRIRIRFHAWATFADGRTYDNTLIVPYYAKHYANGDWSNNVKQDAEQFENDFWYEVSRREDRHGETIVYDIFVEYWNDDINDWLDY